MFIFTLVHVLQFRYRVNFVKVFLIPSSFVDTVRWLVTLGSAGFFLLVLLPNNWNGVVEIGRDFHIFPLLQVSQFTYRVNFVKAHP